MGDIDSNKRSHLDTELIVNLSRGIAREELLTLKREYQRSAKWFAWPAVVLVAVLTWLGYREWKDLKRAVEIAVENELLEELRPVSVEMLVSTYSVAAIGASQVSGIDRQRVRKDLLQAHTGLMVEILLSAKSSPQLCRDVITLLRQQQAVVPEGALEDARELLRAGGEDDWVLAQPEKQATLIDLLAFAEDESSAWIVHRTLREHAPVHEAVVISALRYAVLLRRVDFAAVVERMLNQYPTRAVRAECLEALGVLSPNCNAIQMWASDFLGSSKPSPFAVAEAMAVASALWDDGHFALEDHHKLASSIVMHVAKMRISWKLELLKLQSKGAELTRLHAAVRDGIESLENVSFLLSEVYGECVREKESFYGLVSMLTLPEDELSDRPYYVPYIKFSGDVRGFIEGEVLTARSVPDGVFMLVLDGGELEARWVEAGGPWRSGRVALDDAPPIGAKLGVAVLRHSDYVAWMRDKWALESR